jgi:hypothetical protein
MAYDPFPNASEAKCKGALGSQTVARTGMFRGGVFHPAAHCRFNCWSNSSRAAPKSALRAMSSYDRFMRRYRCSPTAIWLPARVLHIGPLQTGKGVM